MKNQTTKRSSFSGKIGIELSAAGASGKHQHAQQQCADFLHIRTLHVPEQSCKPTGCPFFVWVHYSTNLPQTARASDSDCSRIIWTSSLAATLRGCSFRLMRAMCRLGIDSFRSILQTPLLSCKNSSGTKPTPRSACTMGRI